MNLGPKIVSLENLNEKSRAEIKPRKEPGSFLEPDTYIENVPNYVEKMKLYDLIVRYNNEIIRGQCNFRESIEADNKIEEINNNFARISLKGVGYPIAYKINSPGEYRVRMHSIDTDIYNDILDSSSNLRPSNNQKNQDDSKNVA